MLAEPELELVKSYRFVTLLCHICVLFMEEHRSFRVFQFVLDVLC